MLAVTGVAQQVNSFVLQAESPPRTHFDAASFPNTASAPSRLPSIQGPARLPEPAREVVVTSALDQPTASYTSAPAPTSRFQSMQVRSQTWLPSVTPSTQYVEGRRLLDQAHHEHSVAAFASAEASAWNSLRKLAAAADTSSGASTAIANLQIAETAIHEARDFSGKQSPADAATIERLIRCHQTDVLKQESEHAFAGSSIAATEAIDRYMNEARVRLSSVAAQNTDAAEAMDLLASIYLGRSQTHALPQETALTLRRAALQGQPGNAMLASTLGRQLAQAGLLAESRWALEHSLAIQPDADTHDSLIAVVRQSGQIDMAHQMQLAREQRYGNEPRQNLPRIPEVAQLSPEQFASVSQSVMLQSPTQGNFSLASARINSTAAAIPAASSAAPHRAASMQSQPLVPQAGEAATIEPPSTAKPSFIRGWMNRVGGKK